MVINTKYNKGDKVFTIIGFEVKEVEIVWIEIKVLGTPIPSITYQTQLIDNPTFHQKITENHLFPTKQSLILALS